MPATNRTICVVFMLGLFSGSANAADDFPYTAYVATEEAEVVAGPGHRFYATSRLARGTPIEIYREEASGWLAIRPPEGSFSWLPAEFVERSNAEASDDTLTVPTSVGRVKEPTASWIGTAVEHVNEHRQQVTLKTGEVVQILGEKAVADKAGNKHIWFKIAPPAGEFRWIHLRDVSRQKPEPTEDRLAEDDARKNELSDTVTPALAHSEPEEEPAPRRRQATDGGIPLRDLESPARRHDSRVKPAQFQSSLGSESKPVSPDGFVARKRNGSDEIRMASVPSKSPAAGAPVTGRAHVQPLDTRPARQSAELVSRSSRDAVSDSDHIARQLEQIEVDLSLMLGQDKSLWNLAALQDRVQRLVESGGDPISRGRARLVLEKIKQFEGAFDVQDYGPIASRTGEPAPSGGDKVAKHSSAPLADPRYDAEGWLKPVVSRKSDKPLAPYAVVDRDGQPLCFVTPSPGLNLHRYLNKQVGVYGRRGYLEELKRPHVTAERVIDLDRQLR
jgi:hypothetical protein